MQEINVSDPWFLLIKKGNKKIEGRLNKGTFANLKKDDIIKFKNNDSFFMAKIIKIIKYSTFEEYLSQEGLARTLPGIKTIKEGIDIYYKYYTPEQEKEFGILEIYVKLLS
jgi:ASC-1-like (ASCH) protein